MELLRMVSMLCVVFYHILLFGLYPNQTDEWSYKALQIPFHIGVPCFVLISGYFGIRFSFKGLFRLMGMAYFYAIVIEILAFTLFGYDFKASLRSMFVIGSNRHWFLTTYLWLYLLSPVVNKFLKDITSKQRIYLLTVLAFMVFYSGHIMQTDGSLGGGKNVVNFIFLYTIGNTIHTYQERLNKLAVWKFLIPYIIFNICICIVGYYKHDSYMLPLVGNVWHRCFEYDSIGMYLNVILVTIMFSKMQFVSTTINWIAGSVFSMYLISVSFIWEFVRSTSVQIDNSINNSGMTLLACFALSIAFMLFCVVVDKALTPVWHILISCGKKFDNKTRIVEVLNK